MTKPTTEQKLIQKKAVELSKIAGEGVLEVHYYDNGDYVALLETKNAAQKIHAHYKDIDKEVRMGFSINLNNWYVMFTEVI